MPRLCLQGFHEQAIHFLPTFKLYPGSVLHKYNLKRIPAWTDRILHTVNADEHCSIQPVYYRQVRLMLGWMMGKPNSS